MVFYGKCFPFSFTCPNICSLVYDFLHISSLCFNCLKEPAPMINVHKVHTAGCSCWLLDLFHTFSSKHFSIACVFQNSLDVESWWSQSWRTPVHQPLACHSLAGTWSGFVMAGYHDLQLPHHCLPDTQQASWRSLADPPSLCNFSSFFTLLLAEALMVFGFSAGITLSFNLDCSPGICAWFFTDCCKHCVPWVILVYLFLQVVSVFPRDRSVCFSSLSSEMA